MNERRPSDQAFTAPEAWSRPETLARFLSVLFLSFRGALSFRCAAPMHAISAGEVIVQERQGIFSIPSLPSGL